MKPIYSFFLGMAVTVETVLLWAILFAAADLSVLSAFLLSLGIGAVSFFGVKGIVDYKFLKQNRLTRKEYAYIQRNLSDAQKKISRLQKAFLSVRTMGAFKQLYELSKLAKKMYAIIKKEPRRFYEAERFFFYHLDSVVELSERYARLAAQPVKNDQIYISLKETQSTLEDLSESIKKDIYHVLATDVDDLRFELDVARHSLKKLEYNPLDEERRTKDD